MDVAVDLTLLVIAWAHVLVSPYTKVEESFNLHATHDVFFYGVAPEALKSVSVTILLFVALTYDVLL
jgi:alpha-1,6-mannosyltransferase